jgi:hypothetical protein
MATTRTLPAKRNPLMLENVDDRKTCPFSPLLFAALVMVRQY